MALTGILPIIQQLVGNYIDSIKNIPPAALSLSVALAGILLALDKFFGYSSGWIRYITTEMAIKQAQEQFELDWQAAYASFGGKEPTNEQVQAVIAMIRTFTGRLNTLISNETAQWVAEFKESLRQMDEQSKAQASAQQTGSLSIEVQNGDIVDAPGWELKFDQNSKGTYQGKTAAFINLALGDYTVRITGKINSKDVRGEAVAQIRPGALAALRVSLS